MSTPITSMSMAHSSSSGLLLGSYRGSSTRSSRSQTREERLRQAASQGDEKMVLQMLNNGADGEQGDAYGVTPLMHACMSSSLGIVKELIEYSVHVNAKDKYGQTALHFAAAFGHIDIVKYLLEHKASVHAVTVAGQTPLMKAIYNTTHVHSGEVIRLLLKYKAKVNAQADDGRTALHIAIEHDNIGAVHILISTPGIDLNIPAKDGRIPIHTAAFMGSTLMMETLVIAGAKIDMKTKKGETIYDIQPLNESLRLPPGALREKIEKIVEHARQQAAEEKKKTLINAQLEEKSKAAISRHAALTYEEEQKQIEEMTASRRNQYYKNMSQLQQAKGDSHLFHYDYTKPHDIDLKAKPEPEKDIPVDIPVAKEIIPTSMKQSQTPPHYEHHTSILEQKSQAIDPKDIIPTPQPHVHHIAGVQYVHHGEYKPNTLPTQTPPKTPPISTPSSYSIKVAHTTSTIITPTTTATTTTTEKKIYTINLGGKK